MPPILRIFVDGDAVSVQLSELGEWDYTTTVGLVYN